MTGRLLAIWSGLATYGLFVFATSYRITFARKRAVPKSMYWGMGNKASLARDSLAQQGRRRIWLS